MQASKIMCSDIYLGTILAPYLVESSWTLKMEWLLGRQPKFNKFPFLFSFFFSYF